MFKLPRTKQRVFNKVVRHLLKQNERSIIDHSCQYRGPNGAMCAAGCLISDEYYRKSIEGQTWTVLVKNKAVPANHVDFIRHLQRIHDGVDVDHWPDRLKELGLKYNLDVSCVEKHRRDKS
jgi:hypothetical protein